MADTNDLVARLRQGRLVAPSVKFEIGGQVSESGETREVAHPDALAAADVIERLTNERKAAGMVRVDDVLAILENGFTCMACDTFFLTTDGHEDEDCPKGRASWNGASDEQKLAAIRALSSGNEG